MSGYRAIARVYDRLNADVDYEKWADDVERVFDRFLPSRPELVLDLACGTGRMTYPLAARGYDMIGVDISADMLMRARANQTDEKILWLLQDMRSFELYGTVGAVVCCLDAVNCLTGAGDLERCFATVHNYLDPDGLFLFDVNSPYKFENVFSDNAYVLEDDGIYCGWQNYYDKEKKLCDFYLSVFEREEDGSYSRYDETQTERCYSESQLRKALEKTGFEFLGIYGGSDMSEVRADSERLYVAARAKKTTL
ncbi:MAG: class I SAM-dependent methyltransferase [Clostridia bacterium]|nr:class I SAM-dependent methyltransferase [Clostridia bacterium]